MQDFCVITPSRDRPLLLAHCKEQMKRCGVENHIIVDYEPISKQPDLVERIRTGIELAKYQGFDKVYIVEDDDYYPSTYFEELQFGEHDFIGFRDTVYYNLQRKTFQRFYHERRSSLFTTGFKISALSNFIWPVDTYLWLDIELWRYAFQQGKKTLLLDINQATGMKGHEIGTSGGKGHSINLSNRDNDLHFLRSRVKEDFQFYKQFIK